MTNRNLARWSVLALGTGSLLAGCSAGDNFHSRARDTATQRIYSTLGNYSVTPLGVPSAGAVVTATSLNDSGIVVGFVQGTQGTQAFRWRDGVFQLLAPVGAQATEVNELGDVVGRATSPVIWPHGDTQATELLPPDSPWYATGVPRSIDSAGRVLVFKPGSWVMLAPGTHQVEAAAAKSFDDIEQAPMGEGQLVGERHRQGTAGLYDYLQLTQAGVGLCNVFVHGLADVYAVSDSGYAVGDLYSSIGSSGWQAIRFTASSSSSCDVETLDPGFVETDPNAHSTIMWAINTPGWMAGKVRGLAAVMLPATTGFASLDSVLMASGGAAAAWKVDSVIKLNDAGVFLARASSPGQVNVPVLLRPVGSH